MSDKRTRWQTSASLLRSVSRHNVHASFPTKALFVSAEPTVLSLLTHGTLLIEGHAPSDLDRQLVVVRSPMSPPQDSAVDEAGTRLRTDRCARVSWNKTSQRESERGPEDTRP